MQVAIKELQDAMVVMAHVEKLHAERLVQSDMLQRRTEQNLAEIADKLNSLIGYIDGQRKN